MRLIDTHTHLLADVFNEDLEVVLEDARNAGVVSIVVVSETLQEAIRCLELCERYPMLKAAIGLFPTNLDLEEARQIAALARERASELVAIGEVGLDYWIVKTDEERALQREILGLFVDVANDLELPLNVHSRSAGHYTIDFLLEKGARKVQLHAFDGKASHAVRGAEAGFYFSVPPSIIRSRQKEKMVRRLPLDAILLETDSPVLGPERDSRNVPTNVKVSLAAIADLKGVTEENLAKRLHANTLALYGSRVDPEYEG